MNFRVLFVFCCTIIIQVIHAAPRQALPFEVSSSTGNVGVDNALIQGATAGDVLLKTPEPLTTSAAINDSVSGLNGSSVAAGVADSANEIVDQEVTDHDHFLPDTTTIGSTGILNGNTASSVFPIAASSSSPPSPTSLPTSASTTAITSSPLDNQFTFSTSGPATTTGLTGADPMSAYKMLINMIRQQDQLMRNMYSPFTGMFPTTFPAVRMPTIRIPTPNIPSTHDPSLKLVDQQTFNEGDIKGQIKKYESRPDPNTVTKMQTGEFTVNKDGVEGQGKIQHYVSSSSSSSSGDNPAASVSTYFSGIPSHMNLGSPKIGFRFT